MWFMNKIGDDIEQLAKAIEDNPKLWVQNEYCFVLKANPSISIWTASGTSYIKLTGHDRSVLSMKEKRRVVSAIHVCMRKQIGIAAQEAVQLNDMLCPKE